MDYDQVLNLNQSVNLSFNDKGNQLYYDLNKLDDVDVKNLQKVFNKTKFMKIKIEETDSMYILYNPEKDINPEEHERYKNISEAELTYMDSNKTKAISDFPDKASRAIQTNLKPSKYLYASDNKLYPDTITVKDNKTQESKKYAFWHSYEDFPKVVHINTDAESRYKNININVVDRKNNISISDLTYLKTKNRLPSKAWAFKKGDRVLIPITKNGKTINNEKALVNEKYSNKIISLQDKKGGDGFEIFNLRSAVTTTGYLIVFLTTIGSII